MRKQMSTFLIFALGFAVLMATSVLMAEMPYTTTKTGDCGAGVGAPKGRVGLRRIADPEGGWQTKGFVADWFGPMPQTAYDPNFGCYPGNARTIHRYPAFHGYYYAAPYNYRHYAEYPWNAEIVEPKPYPNNARVAPAVGVPVLTPADSVEQIIQEIPMTTVPPATSGSSVLQ